MQDLFLTHRLDAATTGIVLIARSKDSQRYFSGLFDGKQHSRISKVYKALTRNSLPLGSLHHYQYKKTVGAQILSNSQPSKSDGWKLSEMTILSCKSITTVAADESQLYESEIKLLTGRKHQIRAQFAAIKSPILNDTLYQAVDGLTLENFEDVDSMMRDSRYVNARAPCGSIGLHANRLDFIDTRGDRISISCPPPWTNR